MFSELRGGFEITLTNPHSQRSEKAWNILQIYTLSSESKNKNLKSQYSHSAGEFWKHSSQIHVAKA